MAWVATDDTPWGQTQRCVHCSGATNTSEAVQMYTDGHVWPRPGGTTINGERVETRHARSSSLLLSDAECFHLLVRLGFQMR